MRWKEEDLKAFKAKKQKWFAGVDIDQIHSHPKYGNRKTVLDGITFDSQKEAKRYGELKLLEAAGEISHLELQVRYELKVKGHSICAYIADFIYTTKDKKVVVEDTKGFKTRDYLIKKKLMKAIHVIEVKET